MGVRKPVSGCAAVKEDIKGRISWGLEGRIQNQNIHSNTHLMGPYSLTLHFLIN